MRLVVTAMGIILMGGLQAQTDDWKNSYNDLYNGGGTTNSGNLNTQPYGAPSQQQQQYYYNQIHPQYYQPEDQESRNNNLNPIPINLDPGSNLAPIPDNPPLTPD